MPNILYIKISQEGQEICLSERKEKELPRETGTCCSEGKLNQQKKLLAFVRDHENFAVHLPMLQIMDWHWVPVWGTDRTDMERRGHEKKDRFRGLPADL